MAGTESFSLNLTDEGAAVAPKVAKGKFGKKSEKASKVSFHIHFIGNLVLAPSRLLLSGPDALEDQSPLWLGLQP